MVSPTVLNTLQSTNGMPDSTRVFSNSPSLTKCKDKPVQAFQQIQQTSQRVKTFPHQDEHHSSTAGVNIPHSTEYDRQHLAITV